MKDPTGKKLKVGDILYTVQLPAVDVHTCIEVSSGVAEFRWKGGCGVGTFKLTKKAFKESLWRIR